MKKKTKVTNDDIKSTSVLVQMESGKILELNHQNQDDFRDHFDIMIDNIEAGNKIKRIGVKVELNDGGWIKTDGNRIASRNVSDARFLEYLTKITEAMRPIFLEGFNAYNESDIMTVLLADVNFKLALQHLNKEYGYRY